MIIRHRTMLGVILTGLLISGCAYPTERYHPQFHKYRQPMGVLLVLVPEIGIYEQMPDGSRLIRDIQSKQARQLVQQAIDKNLLQRDFLVQNADARMMQRTEIQSITSLFRSVNRSIQLHTFGPQIYPAKLNAFEYDLGPVADTLKACKADGMILALGHQTGSPQPVKNWLSIAVVEPGGRIIWYSVQGDHQKYNLLNPEDLTALVGDTMVNFWEQGL